MLENQEWEDAALCTNLLLQSKSIIMYMLYIGRLQVD